MKKEKRDKFITLRCTAPELELVEEKAKEKGFKNQRDYIRSAIGINDLSRKVQPTEKEKKQKVVKVADPKLLSSLGQIGNNINQIARKINMMKELEIEEAQKLYVVLSVLSLDLEEVRKCCVES